MDGNNRAVILLFVPFIYVKQTRSELHDNSNRTNEALKCLTTEMDEINARHESCITSVYSKEIFTVIEVI